MKGIFAKIKTTAVGRYGLRVQVEGCPIGWQMSMLSNEQIRFALDEIVKGAARYLRDKDEATIRRIPLFRSMKGSEKGITNGN